MIKSGENYFCKDYDKIDTICQFSTPTKLCAFENVAYDKVVFHDATCAIYNNSVTCNLGQNEIKINNSITLAGQNKINNVNDSLDTRHYFLSQEDVDLYYKIYDLSSFLDSIDQYNFPVEYKVWVFLLSIISTIAVILSIVKGIHFLSHKIIDSLLNRQEAEGGNVQEMTPLRR